jgi:hypothetical protein
MKTDLLKLETELVSAGCVNGYHAALVSHLKCVLKKVLERDVKFSRARDGQDNTDDVDGDEIKLIYNIVDEYDRMERAQRHGQSEISDTIATPSPAERASEGLEVLETLGRLRQKVLVSCGIDVGERVLEVSHTQWHLRPLLSRHYSIKQQRGGTEPSARVSAAARSQGINVHDDAAFIASGER